MPKATFTYPRYIKQLLIEALKDSPAVLIHGPRQCGKTTLSRMIKGYEYMSFDDPMIIEAAKIDPIGFVNGLSRRVILDEIQKVPHLFSILKSVIDNNRICGRFILTGSANILKMPKLSDSLAGRMQLLRLHPLSKGEHTSHKSCFLDSLFNAKFKNKKIKDSSKYQFIDYITMGGYPVALTLPTERRRSNWYRSYMETIIQRDVLDFSKIRSIDILPRLLAVAANQTSQLFNVTHLASAFQVSRTTIYDYMTLLERLFFLMKLQPWRSHRSNRLIKTPKIHLGDSGLACSILNMNSKNLLQNRSLLGQVFETFVFQELQRQASYHKQHHNFFYYRDKKGFEVDIVIERDHLISGIEVKSAATVNLSDFKGLRVLKKVTGERFACGVVLYNGEFCVRFGQGFYALPLRFLWL